MNTGPCEEDVEDEITGYIDKINADIGFYWWKRYIYSAFWSNISTPINLSIVVLTTLTTGQAATQSLLTPEITTILSSVTLFVSIFNSFFKPYEQMTQNQKILQEWSDIGDKFDEIYYDRVYTLTEKKERLVKLETLFKSMSSLKRANDNNYCIDFLYIFIRMICIRKNMNWVTIKEVNAKNKERRNTMLRSINAAPAVISVAPTNAAPAVISAAPAAAPTIATPTTNQVISAHSPVLRINDVTHNNYGTDSSIV